MHKLNDHRLLECIYQGYRTALSMVGRPKFANEERGQGNRLLSKKFVWEVSKNIHEEIFGKKHDLNVIEVDDNGESKSGEWLVDACITEGKKTRREFIRKIIFAMESESGVDKPAFNEDFAKLVHIKASHKLYLNGLNQRTPDGAKKYIKERLEHAMKFLNEEDADTFYLGFWPSPGKSMWKQLGKVPHLNKIHLYKFSQKGFHLIGEKGGAD